MHLFQIFQRWLLRGEIQIFQLGYAVLFDIWVLFFTFLILGCWFQIKLVLVEEIPSCCNNIFLSFSKSILDHKSLLFDRYLVIL